jgi:hypothetical protein
MVVDTGIRKHEYQLQKPDRQIHGRTVRKTYTGLGLVSRINNGGG